MRAEIEEAYLMYGIAFDLYLIVTGNEVTEENITALAHVTSGDILEHGYEKTLAKILGRIP